MADADNLSSRASFAALRIFLRDFLAFSGRRFAFAVTYVSLGAIFEGLGLILLVPLLGLVTGSSGGNGYLQRAAGRAFAALSITTPLGRLAFLLSGFVALMALRAVVILLRDTSVLSLQTEFVENLRARIMSRLASAGWDRVMRLRHARVLQVMSGDIQRVAVAATFLLQSGTSLVILAVQCALAFWLAPWLALLAFALLALGGLALIPVLRQARALGAFVTDANLALTKTTSEFLNGLKLAVSQDLQDGFITEFRDTLHAIRDRQFSYVRLTATGRVAFATVSALVGAVAVLVGYGLLGINAPVLIAFLLIIARMSVPATQIQQGLQQIAFGLPAYEESLALLDELQIAPISAAAPPIVPADRPIVFESVSFRHSHEDETRFQGVRSVDLELMPGTFLGIVGPSGSGKTTLADLLVGLLKPQRGRITVGGIPLADDALPSWRAQLSYISQDPFLFHDSVRRNLLWGNPSARETDLWAALALAGADGIVRRMTGGLDASVGEHGALISGGERQRFALARALLRKPRLLVMDEATNAIDIPSERALLERMIAIRPRMTIMMIAHRAESLMLCDQIFRMDDGTLQAEPNRKIRSQTHV